MKRILALSSTLLLLPLLTLAQAAAPAPTGGFQLFFSNLLKFINTAIIPSIIGIAFLFLVINTVRYFVIGAGNEESREKAKSLAIYGVLAFVVIIVFWGVVNLLSSSIGLDGKTAPTVDYVQINTPRN